MLLFYFGLTTVFVTLNIHFYRARKLVNFRLHQLLQNLCVVLKIFFNFAALLPMIQLHVCYRWYKAVATSLVLLYLLLEYDIRK